MELKPHSFEWRAAGEVLGALSAEHGPFALAPTGRSFVSEGLRVRPPLVLPWAGLPAFGKRARQAVPTAQELAARRAGPGCALARYVAGLERVKPHRFVLLLQAGAASMGAFGEEHADDAPRAPLATKSIKRYTVRGVGRAQATHLKAKGKSRYGARLRLQNTRRLFDEVHAKLASWCAEFGAPRVAYVAAPERLWSDFRAFREQPPFGECGTILGVSEDVPVPVTEVLLDIEARLGRGHVEPLAHEG